MCTPLTTDRLMRWKLRRKTSNFFSCSIPLRLPSVIDDIDDEPTKTTLQNSVPHHQLYSEPPKSYNKSIEEEQQQQHQQQDDEEQKEQQQQQEEKEEEEEKQKDIRINESNPKLSLSTRCSSMFIERFEAELPESDNELHCPPIADGDYIVFCFKEDGEFDIVKEKISGEFDVIEDTMVRLRPINRKLIYSGEENNREDHNMLSEGEVDLDTRNEWDSNTSDEKADDGESIYFDPESPTRNHEENHRCVECEEEPTTSVESSNSTNQSSGSTNRSDGSTASFAFPVLNREWTGSPIKMPNLRSGLHMRRRHRDRKLKFHCCKF